MPLKFSNHRYPRGFYAFITTQFLGAFNDNAFKMTLLLLAIASTVSGLSGYEEGSDKTAIMIAITSAIFIFPFLMFASWAGTLSDRTAKHKVIFRVKTLEIFIMTVAMIGLFLKSLPVLFVALFLMGLQSALFGPAKYGILPEVLPEKDLSRGNGVLAGATFAAILLGTGFGGWTYVKFEENLWIAGVIYVALALAGATCAVFVPRTRPADLDARFSLNPFGNAWETIRKHWRNSNLAAPIWGVAAFWTIALFIQLTIVLMAKSEMGLDENSIRHIMTMLAFSIGMGNILAAYLSGNRVEIGLVPIGAFGLSVALCLYTQTNESFSGTLAVTALGGLSAGLFILPLNALIQRDAPEETRGSVLAMMNFLANAGMLAAPFIFLLLTRWSFFPPSDLLLISGVVLFLVSVWLFLWLKMFILRFAAWILTHTIYRIRIEGLENLPKRGGALLVCNHVTWVDALLITAVVPRFVRFIMLDTYYEKPIIGALARIMKAIPVSQEGGIGGMKKTLRRAMDELKRGQVVCIFPEGQITRTGNMQPFQRGAEFIARQSCCAPVIPVYLDNLWGSVFSYYGGRFFWKIPRKFPYPITITFGSPMPPESKITELRQQVMDLSATAFPKRPSLEENLFDGFLRTVRQNWRRQAVSDTLGTSLTYGRLLTACTALRGPLRRAIGRLPEPPPEIARPAIGIALPPSAAGFIVNLTCYMMGCIPIHLNFTSSEEALRIARERTRLTHVITSRKFLEKINVNLPGELIYMEDLKEQVSKKRAAAIYLTLSIMPLPFLRIIANPLPPHADDVATVVFSSGSTGIPKGVMLTHRNIRSNVEAVAQAVSITVNDRLGGILPFFHSFGLTATIWLPVLLGVPVDYHISPLDTKGVSDLVSKNKVTVLIATPTFSLLYIKRIEPEAFESLRIFMVGAEKLKPATAEAFKAKFGDVLYEGYGATECTPVVCVNIPDLEDPEIDQIGNKLGTVGQPIPGVTVHIVPIDEFSGKDSPPSTYVTALPPGEEGMLWVSGPNVMKGYLGQPEKTAEVLVNGWYKTGDIASIDEHGFVTIHGRLSRFSKIGGEMVPHENIESIMMEAVGEQGRVAVTGVPDDKKGERLVVLFEGDLEPETLIASARQAGVPNLWLPGREDFYPVDELPVLGTGKLDLKKLNVLAANLVKA